MSYFTNLLTATKTRYAAFRTDLDTDGDTEDDSHISRVLRTYYQERPELPYPDWLGPPPTTHSPSPNSPVTGSLRSSYGRNSHAQNHSPASLSDIWDAPPQPGRVGGMNGRGGGGPQQQLPPPGQRYRVSEPQQTVSTPPQTVMSAQQRLKERLWGGRSSPAAQTQHHPPPPREERPYVGAGMPWDDGDGGMGYQAPAYYGGGREDRGQRDSGWSRGYR
ncbi:hypothetical protein EX30DRAFT_340000 [Ascodesmis nigricans]|uniref:Mso1 N-terminal domain-containing protein n=1 Tax=Ascodesmis nigricans TaxID=341454 RepID=A0A4S2MZA7_9PEZI|nr:hypothetical protein EX30DRAFT_340000 [Ascodesmis nigricans]